MTAKKSDEPRVQIRLPMLEDENGGMDVDQYEHVTINGDTTMIKRGEYVDVTIPVFEQLKRKYPGL